MSTSSVSRTAPAAVPAPDNPTSAVDVSRRGHDAVTPVRTVPAPGGGRRRRNVDLSAVATRLAGERHLWAGLVDFDPLTRYYARIAAEKDWEAWLLTWLPGQGTQWHDHGDSAGSFVVLQGELTERVAVRGEPNGRALTGRDATRLRAGQQRTFGRTYVHHVGNEGFDPAVSLHVYAPRLTVMTTYVVDGTSLHPVQTQQTGVDW